MNRRLRTMWFVFAVAGFAFTGCGEDAGLSGIVGSESSTENAAGLGKLAATPAPMGQTEVVVQVADAGEPLADVEVVFLRTIGGKTSSAEWSATTNAAGEATVAIDAAGSQFWRTGVNGYYEVTAPTPTGATVGQWGSIPVNGSGRNVISLPVGGKAQIHARGPKIRVMTRNVFLGADINRILVPDDPTVPIPVLVAQTWGMIQQTNFAERTKALADEIATTRPHLVGLQEVSLYRMQIPGDVLLGNTTAAEDVALDFLEILLTELAARGQSYRAVAVAAGIDIELPMALSATEFTDIRMTDREVILARAGVHIGDVVEKQFDVALPFNLAGVDTQIPRAWASVEATVAGPSAEHQRRVQDGVAGQ